MYQLLGDTRITLNFTLSGDADDVNIILTGIYNAPSEHVIPMGALKAGKNSVSFPRNTYGAGSVYIWTVEAFSPAIKKAERCFVSDRGAVNTRGGVAFVDSPDSPYYGKVIVSNGSSGGIEIYSQNLEKQGSYHVGKFDSGLVSSPNRIAEDDGIVFLSDLSEKGMGIRTFVPENPDRLGTFFDGTSDGKGGIQYDGVYIGGKGSCVSFCGEGESRFMLACNYDVDGKTNLVSRYNIGTANSWSKPADVTYPNISSNLLTNNVEIIALENGFFVSQVRRGSQNVSSPAFMYCDYNDRILYNSGKNTKDIASCGTGMAISDDLSVFALSQYKKGITIFDVSWKGNVPSFTYKYVLPETKGEISQMDFDVAGNLHIYSMANGYEVFVLPNEKPRSLSRAGGRYKIKGTETGVENIRVENAVENSVVEYYNLQGLKVNPENLGRGIYIKVRGEKSEKVVVK